MHPQLEQQQEALSPHWDRLLKQSRQRRSPHFTDNMTHSEDLCLLKRRLLPTMVDMEITVLSLDTMIEQSD